jgi:hypothetical protein
VNARGGPRIAGQLLGGGKPRDQIVIRYYQKSVPNLTRRDGDALARALDKQRRPR